MSFGVATLYLLSVVKKTNLYMKNTTHPNLVPILGVLTIALIFFTTVYLKYHRVPADHDTSTSETNKTASTAKETVSPLTNANLNVVWYDISHTGEATNILYMASWGDQRAAFRPYVGKAEQMGGVETLLTEADLARWTETFIAFEKNGAVPKLPLSFMDGEYEFSEIDSETVTVLRKTSGGEIAHIMTLGNFGSRPYYGHTFKIAKITRDGEEKLYPVAVSDPVQGRLGYVVLSLRP